MTINAGEETVPIENREMAPTLPNLINKESPDLVPWSLRETELEERHSKLENERISGIRTEKLTEKIYAD